MALAGRDLPAEMAATGQERERLVAEARRSLDGYPAPVRAEFEFLLAAAQQAVVLSEDHNFWIDARAMYQVRRVFLEFGRRLAAAGVIEETKDVFALTLDELRETARELPRIDRHALVAERRAEMERFRSISPPEQLGHRPPNGRAGRLSQPATERGILQGHAGSSGIARGQARVVRTLAEAGKLRPGDILVAETLSSSWTPLFATVAAVVTDTGGILSHAAVVAREYRIPAVLGTDAATSLLRDGQLLEVDGDRGTIRLISSG
jgi:pyruvate,water dikinase